jgi:predicted alpha/beta-fold hydrolase
MEAYEAPWWAPGRDWQTIAGSLLPKPSIAFRRERWRTPGNDDFIDVDWAGPEHAPRVLVLFHGVGGNSNAHYILRMGAAALETGCWRIAVPHFRGCSGEPNERARLYFSGDFQEIEWMLQRFRSRTGAALSAVGVSLGGNSLLKWLCERGDSARNLVGRAVAVSAQFDLLGSARALGGCCGRVYGQYFLECGGMRKKALAKFDAFGAEFSRLKVRRKRIEAARTLPQFDGAFVAPLHGFRNAKNYWRLCSTSADLGRIAVPTLLLNARNDRFYPENLLPPQNPPPSPWIQAEFTDSGGHAGFPGRNNWMGRRVLEFLSPA